MKLEDIKRIAAARTKGEWRSGGEYSGRIFYGDDGIICQHINSNANMEFIAMAANNWDDLMAALEAAKSFLYYADYYGKYGRSLNGHHESWKNIHETLEALEKE